MTGVVSGGWELSLSSGLVEVAVDGPGTGSERISQEL